MKRLFFLLLGLSGVLVTGTLVLVYLVFLAPTPDFGQTWIQKSLLKETRVYYRDEQSSVGTFSEFSTAYLHVSNPTQIQYTPETTLPPLFLNALLALDAAEKETNSGTTLASRTAELLWMQASPGKTPSKSRGAWTEFLDVSRLEARYSQNEILEFYSNTFHVPGGGQGLGTAARYYFAKKITKLNLGELAFIASLFQSKIAPRENAEQKKEDPELQRNRVLRHMKNRGYISQEELELASKTPLLFKRMALMKQNSETRDPGSQDSIPMSLVRQTLKREPFIKLLKEKGVKDLSQSQFKIYTTLDFGLQYISQFELRRHRSRLEFSKHAYRLPRQKLTPSGTTLRAGEFYVGRIARIQQPDSPSILINVAGEYAVVKGGLMDEFVRRVLKRKSQSLSSQDYQKALRNLRKGSPIRIALHTQNKMESIPSEDQSDNQSVILRPWKASIEQETSLNGGVFVVQNGEIRAVVGETSKKRDQNLFSILLYWAAVELGWDALEPIPKRQSVFSWKNNVQIPSKPASENLLTSMLWAGAKSETSANLYLLNRLLKHLTTGQFLQLMTFAGLAPKTDEKQASYASRLQSEFKVLDSSKDLEPLLFQRLQERFLSEYVFEASPELETPKTNSSKNKQVSSKQVSSSLPSEADSFQSLWYGNNWKKHFQTRAKQGSAEAKAEQALLEHNFVRFKELSDKLEKQRSVLVPAFEAPKQTSAKAIERALSKLFIQTAFIRKKTSKTLPPLLYVSSSFRIPSGWQRLTRYRFQLYSRTWNEEQRKQFFSSENIWINGSFRHSLLKALDSELKKELQSITQKPAYTPERLYWNQDFRTLVALKTITRLGSVLGVQNTLKENENLAKREMHSVSWGKNRASLKELALLYQALSGGEMYNEKHNASTPNPGILIQRIEDSEGKTIYQAQPRAKTFISKKSLQSLQEIMRTVVEHGTSRSALSYLSTLRPSLESQSLGSQSSEAQSKKADTPSGWIKLPAYGSPGSTHFLNSAPKNNTYVGTLPLVKKGRATAKGAYTIAVHLGDGLSAGSSSAKNDDTSIALPVWYRIAYYLIHTPEYQNELSSISLPEGEPLWSLPFEQVNKKPQLISLTTGLPSQRLSSQDLPATSETQSATAPVYLPEFQNENKRNISLFSSLKIETP